jgi:hypothetical protein
MKERKQLAESLRLIGMYLEGYRTGSKEAFPFGDNVIKDLWAAVRELNNPIEP